MKRIWWLAVPLLAGSFWLFRERGVSCPSEFSSHRINVNTKYYSGRACSVDPSEIMVDGVKPGDSIQSVIDHWGEPIGQDPPHGPGGVPAYVFSNGVRLIAEGDQVWLIAFAGSDTSLKGPRGISVLTPCEVIARTFGPSHEGPGTYRYSTHNSGSWLTVDFRCEADTVGGFTLSQGS